MKKALLLPLLALLFLLPACGGGGSDESAEQSEAKAVAERYLQAQREGDWAQFCSSLTKQSQEVLRVSVVQTKQSKKKPASCQAALEGSSLENQNALKQATAGVQIVSVAVSEKEATLIFEKGGAQDIKNMYLEDGSWKMSVVTQN